MTLGGGEGTWAGDVKSDGGQHCELHADKSCGAGRHINNNRRPARDDQINGPGDKQRDESGQGVLDPRGICAFDFVGHDTLPFSNVAALRSRYPIRPATTAGRD